MYPHIPADIRVVFTSDQAVDHLSPGDESMMNDQRISRQGMQQMMAEQQQQQLQHHFQMQLMQNQQQQQHHHHQLHKQEEIKQERVIPQPSFFAQQAYSQGQQFVSYQQSVQVLADPNWPNQFMQAPVISQQQVAQMQVVPTNPGSSNSGMKTVSSQGLLLPLVPMPETSKSVHREENPKEQMAQCMGVIEEALQDPSLADAGKMLLQAMHASSVYMNDLLEANKRSSPTPLKPAATMTNPKKRFFLDAPKSAHESIQKVSYHQTQTNPYYQTQINPATKPSSQAAQHELRQGPIHVSSSSSYSKPPFIQPKPAEKSSVSKQKATAHKATCGKVQKDYKPAPLTATFDGSPHKFLVTILKERGYSTQRSTSQEVGYCSDPTALQVASFGTRVVQAVHSSDKDTLSKLLAAGLSPNPCNQFGDSVLSLICKRADYEVFKVMLDHGCDLQVCDSFGRTCLHSLAWASHFSAQMATAVLDHDLNQLLLEDKRGQCPLECVRKENWSEWISFLRQKLDVYWPVPHNSRPSRKLPRDIRVGSTLEDSGSALSLDIAVKLAAGEITPEQAAKQTESAISNNFDLFF